MRSPKTSHLGHKSSAQNKNPDAKHVKYPTSGLLIKVAKVGHYHNKLFQKGINRILKLSLWHCTKAHLWRAVHRDKE